MRSMTSPTSEWVRLRWEVLRRDDFTCQYCGQKAPNVPLQIDHRIAVADGGTDDLANLVTACWSCNQGKGYSEWSGQGRGRGLDAARRVSTRQPSKTTLLMEALQANPDASDNDLAKSTGLAPQSIAPLRYRVLFRVASLASVGHDGELWHEAMARLIRERGPMTANELAAFGGFTKERIDDSVRRGATEAGLVFELRDGRYRL